VNLSLVGKRALVCGASRGIGRAAAHELAALGAEVVLLARDRGQLEEVRATLPTPQSQHHSYLALDLLERSLLGATIQKTIDQIGPINILINNTGGPPPGALLNAEEEHLVQAFSLHLLSAHLLTQLLVPGMRESRYGRIINVLSTSVRQPLPGLGVSNTIRAAMSSWSKTLAEELAPHGITVNNVLPGATNTDRLRAIIDGKARRGERAKEEIEEEMRREIPVGRFADPSEIAGAIAYLASPAAAYITGTNMCVDGGRTKAL